MKTEWCAAGLALVIASLATADAGACGDKFLVPSRGLRFELKPSVRQEASVLVHVESASAAGQFDKASIGPALRKAGYRPTIAASVDEFDRTLRGASWDVVVLDLSGGVLSLPQAADSPVVLAFVADAKPAHLLEAKKQYHDNPEDTHSNSDVRGRHRCRFLDTACGAGESGEEVELRERIIRTVGSVAATVTVMTAGARPAMAQAWVLPERTGAVTFVVQEIDHVGRIRNDGIRAAVGKAINVGFDLELDYAFTDRLSVSTTLPYVVAKFTDPNPPPEWIPFTDVDACRCWNSDFADFGLTIRYNLINVNRAFMLTPFVSSGLPSHAYDYVGEAVVGRRLKELKIGADAGQRLDWLLGGLSVQAGYRYTIVEQFLDVPNNRSNGSAQAGFVFPRGFSARAAATWQRTHGGLRMPDDVKGFPERLTEYHRMLRDNYLHAGGGVSYSWGPWDISGSFLLTARGSNSHDVRVFSFTIGRLFEIGS